MFRAGHRLDVMRIVALQSANKRDAESAREERVFSISFLAASPARVAEDVDVRRPERQADEQFAIAVVLGGVIVELRPAFNADDGRFLPDQSGIPGGRHADGLGENGRVAVIGHPVQRFAPVIKSRKSQPSDGGRSVPQLGDFLGQRHPADQILCPRLQWLRGIAPDRRPAGFRFGSLRGCRRFRRFRSIIRADGLAPGSFRLAIAAFSGCIRRRHAKQETPKRHQRHEDCRQT